MSGTNAIVDAVEAWAAAVANLNTIERNPEELTFPLPLAFAEVKRKRKVATEADLDRATKGYQQTALRAWSVDLTVLVKPDPDATAYGELNDLVDTITEDLARNRTLGQRVETASPFYDVEFVGEVEHPSGTVARAAVITMTVGEAVEV